jgi:hypothetical protein
VLILYFFFFVTDPAANITDAPQPWGLSCTFTYRYSCDRMDWSCRKVGCIDFCRTPGILCGIHACTIFLSFILCGYRSLRKARISTGLYAASTALLCLRSTVHKAVINIKGANVTTNSLFRFLWVQIISRKEEVSFP